MTGSEGNVSVSQMILIHISISRSFPQDLLGSRKFPSGDPGCQSFPRPYDYTNSVLNGPRKTSHLSTLQDLLRETSWNREDPEGNFLETEMWIRTTAKFLPPAGGSLVASAKVCLPSSGSEGNFLETRTANDTISEFKARSEKVWDQKVAST